MNEHPILFSTLMVLANLDNRKGMTRRIIKPQPSTGLQKGAGDPGWYDTDYECTFHTGKYIKCPYGDVGNLLWVRESFIEKLAGYKYKADFKDQESVFNHTWRPSIHMPKAAARIWLQVEEIRVERLNEISEADAIAEGIEIIDSPRYGKLYRDYMKSADSSDTGYKDAVLSFRSLFLAINGKPKPIRENGERGPIVSYTAIAWDQTHFDMCWAKFNGTYRNKPLEVITNPLVWVVKYKVVSTTGKPNSIPARLTVGQE